MDWPPAKDEQPTNDGMFIATISTLSELKKEKATPVLLVVVATVNKQKAWHGSASVVGPSSSSLTMTLVVTKRPSRPRKCALATICSLLSH
jgi:hypothetical protein